MEVLVRAKELAAAAASASFIRFDEWWYYKVPLPLLLLLLLCFDHISTPAFPAASLFVILAVSAVGNYGHAINEIYDRVEDAAMKRRNAASERGVNAVSHVALGSAGVALAASYFAAGLLGVLVTFAAIVLPMTYSRPPLRLKERLWLGVLADALAAHAFPAALVLLALPKWQLGPVTPLAAIAVMVWSLMLGLRGILSHQVYTAREDHSARLRTIVHALGALTITRLVLWFMLPLEIAALFVIVLETPGTTADYAILFAVLLFVAWEAWHLAKKARHISFSAHGLFFFPGMSNTLYTVWIPTALLATAALRNPVSALYLCWYVAMFWLNFRTEYASGAEVARPINHRRLTDDELVDQIARLRQRDGVDADWYRRQYRLEMVADPVEEYCRSGWRRARDPNPTFSTAQYLLHNRDVVHADVNPLFHFLVWGRREGRKVWPSDAERDG